MAWPVLAEMRSLRPMANNERIWRRAFCCWSLSAGRPPVVTMAGRTGGPVDRPRPGPGRADSKSLVDFSTALASSPAEVDVVTLKAVVVAGGRKVSKSSPWPLASLNESRWRRRRDGRELARVELFLLLLLLSSLWSSAAVMLSEGVVSIVWSA